MSAFCQKKIFPASPVINSVSAESNNVQSTLLQSFLLWAISILIYAARVKVYDIFFIPKNFVLFCLFLKFTEVAARHIVYVHVACFVVLLDSIISTIDHKMARFFHFSWREACFRKGERERMKVERGSKGEIHIRTVIPLITSEYPVSRVSKEIWCVYYMITFILLTIIYKHHEK